MIRKELAPSPCSSAAAALREARGCAAMVTTEGDLAFSDGGSDARAAASCCANRIDLSASSCSDRGRHAGLSVGAASGARALLIAGVGSTTTLGFGCEPPTALGAEVQRAVGLVVNRSSTMRYAPPFSFNADLIHRIPVATRG